MVISVNKLENIILQVMEIAEQAGSQISSIYKSDDNIKISIKEDSSPVTQADKLADKTIRDKLFELTPDIPIISEEFSIPSFSERSAWESLWLVDPLDGTKEFIEKTGEFTVNIALVEKGVVVLGVVGVPATGELFGWYKGAKHSFYQPSIDAERTYLKEDDSSPKAPIRVLVSRRHTNNDNLYKWLENINLPYEVSVCGSSLKMCHIAKGLGDIYIRLGSTSEWDTAAGHAVLKGVGGGIYENSPDYDRELIYNSKASILNPEFIAVRNSEWFKDLWRK